jgi:hypothetical protein
MQKGQTDEAHSALQRALRAAEAIPNKGTRDTTITKIRNALKETEKPMK